MTDKYITFDVAGGEYASTIHFSNVTSFAIISDTEVIVNGAKVKFDEPIVEVR